MVTLFYYANPWTIYKNLLHLPPNYLLIIFLLTLQIPFIQAFRMKHLLKQMGITLSIRKLLWIILGSYPLLLITPSRSGDFIKSYYLRRELEIGKGLGMVLSERIFDLLSLLFLSSFGLIVMSGSVYNSLALFIVSSLIIFTLMVHNTKFSFFPDKLASLVASYKISTSQPSFFLQILSISIIQWALAIFQTFLIFLMLKVDITIFTVFALVPLAILVGQIPLTLGGMGTRDLAFANLFSSFADFDILITIGFIFTFFRYFLLSFIGIPFMMELITKFGEPKPNYE